MGLDERIKRMETIAVNMAIDLKQEAVDEIYKTLKYVFSNIDSMVAIIDYNKNTLEYLNPKSIYHDIQMNTNVRDMIGKDCSDVCKEIKLPIDCEHCPISLSRKSNKVHSCDFKSSFTKEEFTLTAIPLVFNHTNSIIVMISDFNE